jgi:biotin carboxyl carrier protein
VTFEDLIASRVRPLADAFLRAGLASVRLAEADFEIELWRSRAGLTEASVSQERAAEHAAASGGYDVLSSDVVGRVRFVRPPVVAGALIEEGRELAFVEALGIRNPIRSRGRGRVAEVYVEEGQAVDYGAPLFAIERV